ncbi:hypothetical protein JCM3774_006847 [Rhodotorula dairenensis]
MSDDPADVAMADGRLVVASAGAPLPTEASALDSTGELRAGEDAFPPVTAPEATADRQAAVQERPRTPPPSQPVFAAPNPRSGSSQDSMVLATQNTTLSPAESGLRMARTAEPESPDPLQLVPVMSAASSSVRSRSHSIEPQRDFLRSSPSRVSAQSRSRTPVPRDQAGENDPSGSDEVVALRTPRPPRGAESSDDEIGMSPIRASRPRRQANKGRDDPGPAKKATRKKKGSKTDGSREHEDSPAGTQSGPPSNGQAPSAGPSRIPASNERHSFELIIDQPRRSVRAVSRSRPTVQLVLTPTSQPTPRHSPASLALSSSRASPPPADAGLASANGNGNPVASSHPLSQALSREGLVTQSSPLTSLPPTPAARQPAMRAATTPSPSSKSKRSRARASDLAAADASARPGASEDEGEATTTSTISNPSPKKKPRGRAPRASQVAAQTSSDEDAPPLSQPAYGMSLGRAGAKGRPSVTYGRRRQSAISDIPPEVLQHAAQANRNPRRRGSAAAAKPLSSERDEDSDSGAGSDFKAGPSRASPKKAAVSPKKPRPRKKDVAPSSETAPASKGKGTAEATPGMPSMQAENGYKPASSGSIQTPASSPSKQNGLSAPEAFGSQSLATGRATRQTAEERQAGWNILYFPRYRPIWVHVRKDGGDGFWWPGEIETPIYERPISVRLYLDAEGSIKSFSDVHLTIAEPDSELLATFRNPSRLRFDQRIFRDLEDAPADDTPTDEAFATVLAHALERDAGADDEDDEDDLLPAPFGPSGSKASPEKAPAAEDRDDVDPPEQRESGQFSGDEADKLIEADDQDADLEYPFLCLAKAQRTWWAARCTAHVPGSPTKAAASQSSHGKGAQKHTGKYMVEWTDGSTSTVARKDLLTAKQKEFFTVKMGQTGLDVSKAYIARLHTFVNHDMTPIYQQVIDEACPAAQGRNDDFYAGGQKRERLAKRSLYGEYTEELVEIFNNAIRAWASGEGSPTGPPQGSARYAALTDGERVQYRTDVLLPTAIIENYIDDRGFFDEAETQLKSEGAVAPPDDEIKVRAYALAEQDLDLRSVTKAVLAIRESREHVKAINESRRPKRKQ